MKKIFVFVVAVAVILSTSICHARHVNGYTRSNGTYVNGYNRSSSNSTVRDNYSYEGNTNPYTGEEGHNKYKSSPSSEYYDPSTSDSNYNEWR